MRHSACCFLSQLTVGQSWLRTVAEGKRQEESKSLGRLPPGEGKKLRSKWEQSEEYVKIVSNVIIPQPASCS